MHRLFWQEREDLLQKLAAEAEPALDTNGSAEADAGDTQGEVGPLVSSETESSNANLPPAVDEWCAGPLCIH